MSPTASRQLWCAALIASTACGGAPAPDDARTWNPRLQEFSFGALADPGAGRLQLVAAPQPALQVIPEDANGNATSAANSTIQVYGATVSFPALGNAAYPAACNVKAPAAMISNVEVRSGFTEQLRNVYARIDAISGGQTFCSRDSPGAFTNALGPYLGLYLYQPLNPVTASANTALFRSKQWALNLPTNAPYWFSGKLLAEVIPLPPAMTSPADGATVHVAGFFTSTNLSWTLDPLANGSNPEGFSVARPTADGAQLTVKLCGAASGAYDPTSCTLAWVNQSTQTGLSYSGWLIPGYWYQWTLVAGFDLPGAGTTRTWGTLSRTQSFKVVTP